MLKHNYIETQRYQNTKETKKGHSHKGKWNTENEVDTKTERTHWQSNDQTTQKRSKHRGNKKTYKASTNNYKLK